MATMQQFASYIRDSNKLDTETLFVVFADVSKPFAKILTVGTRRTLIHERILRYLSNAAKSAQKVPENSDSHLVRLKNAHEASERITMTVLIIGSFRQLGAAAGIEQTTGKLFGKVLRQKLERAFPEVEHWVEHFDSLLPYTCAKFEIVVVGQDVIELTPFGCLAGITDEPHSIADVIARATNENLGLFLGTN